MGGRWFHIGVVVAWLLAMSWLVVEKVLPTFSGGGPRAYDAYLADGERAPEPVGWRLTWEEEEIGWAVVRSARYPDGSVHVRSIVQLKSLPVDRLFTQLLGTFGAQLHQAVAGSGELRLEVAVTTNMEYTAAGRVRRFVSGVHSGGIRDLMRVEGTVDGRRMSVVVFGRTDSPSGLGREPTELFRHEVDLPKNVMISSSFSPQPRLTNLRVGQRWTFPVYRPFPPGSPAEIMEAQVERETNLLEDDQETRVFLVVFRSEAGSGISAAQEPTARMWVRRDGTVLQQEVQAAGVRLQFRRTPGSHFRARAMQLDPGWDNTELPTSGP